jgi:hypothetical protein
MNETIGAAGQGSERHNPRGAVALLWLLAAAVIACTLAIPPAFRVWGDNAYMAFALATGIAALAATFVAGRAPTAHALWLIVAVAVLLRGILLFTEPLLSTDIYRYVWDGRVQGAGVNPYRHFPAHEALTALRDSAIYPRIDRADYAVTIYPPAAQMFFFAVTRIGETVTMMKLALLACEGVTVALIVLLLRRIGRPATRLVAYLWHPLPLWEIANSGHVDALTIALMMLGIWLGLSGRPLRGAASIALGALAKPIALLALPAIWRPWDWKLPCVVIAAMLLCYIPYLSVGWGVLGFLTQGYLSEEAFDSGDRIWPLAVWRWFVGSSSGDVTVYFSVGALAVAALAINAAFHSQQAAAVRLANINNLLLLGLFVVSPNYPWYFLAVTPFVALVGRAPAWALTLGATLLQEEAGWGLHIPELLRKSILYGAFIAAWVYCFWRSRSHALRADDLNER